MNRIAWSVVAICFWAAPHVRAAAESPAKPMTAEAVLERYVQVTGGADLYHRYGGYSKYSTLTRADGSSFNVAEFHSRDGSTRVEIDAGEDSSEYGVASGIVWEYSKAKGARILEGKFAAWRLAETRGLDEDDWRIRYPKAQLLGTQIVDGKSCYRVKLTRTDGSTLERVYDVRSGLIVREVSTGFDENGAEVPLTIDLVEYDSSVLSPKHPSLLHVKEGSKVYSIHVDSLTFYPANGIGGSVPAEVVRAVAERRSGGSLPNAVDLVERFIQATGGTNAYQSIKTEAVQAEISLVGQNVKFPIEMYAAKGKVYSSLDIPTMGKFEFGSDGTTSWERSVMLGPKLTPRSYLGGLLGPDTQAILGWTQSDLTLQTIGKDDVNGAPCFKVKMGQDVKGQPASTACFDVQSSFLAKATSVQQEGPNLVNVETIFSDYRADGPIKTPYRIETKLAGEKAVIEVKRLAINQPVPEGIFDLPTDVKALKQKKQADLDKADAASPPTLKKDRY